MFYDLAGHLTLSVDARDERFADYVKSQMDPYGPSESSTEEPDVRFTRTNDPVGSFRDIQNPATDGLVTASDDRELSIVIDGRACVVPDPLSSRPADFRYQSGFPMRRIFSSVLRPALQVAMHRRDSAVLHGAAVEIGGAGVVVAGWSESGKTETALALAETGAGFVSDKWTIVGADSAISAFPINVGIRRWVVPYLPRLGRGLPRRARAQLTGAAVASGISRPVRSLRTGPAARAGHLAETIVALADRAALSPAEIRAAYGQSGVPAPRTPLSTVALLTTIPEGAVQCSEVDVAWAAARLARTGAYERRRYFAIRDRAGYAYPRTPAAGADAFAARDAELIARNLAGVRLLEVRAPFPTDPRPVADAIRERL